MFDEISKLPVYEGSMFEWRGNVGWTTTSRLGYSFEPGYIDWGDTPAFVVRSHRTGVKKVFEYKERLRDEDGNFDGTRWVSLDGCFEIQIEWNPW